MDTPAQGFELVGPHPAETQALPPKKRRWFASEVPYLSFVILGLILLGCLFCECFIPKDPSYLDLSHISQPPGGGFLFGTDPMGRDIFSMIWYGGRISLFIGFVAAAVSTAIAVVYGCISGFAPAWLDDALMRFAEMAMSIPSILVIIFLQAMIGQSNPLAIACIIGLTSWMNIAKVVRTEVRQIQNSEYILAAKLMGGRFFYILRRHLLPNFISISVSVYPMPFF